MEVATGLQLALQRARPDSSTAGSSTELIIIANARTCCNSSGDADTTLGRPEGTPSMQAPSRRRISYTGALIVVLVVLLTSHGQVRPWSQRVLGPLASSHHWQTRAYQWQARIKHLHNSCPCIASLAASLRAGRDTTHQHQQQHMCGHTDCNWHHTAHCPTPSRWHAVSEGSRGRRLWGGRLSDPAGRGCARAAGAGPPERCWGPHRG